MFIKIENTIEDSGEKSSEKEFTIESDIRVVRGALVIRDNDGTVLENLTGLDDYQISLKTADYNLIKMQGASANNTIDLQSLRAFLESESMPSFVLKQGEIIKMQTQHTAAGSGIIQAMPVTITLSLMFEKVKQATLAQV